MVALQARHAFHTHLYRTRLCCSYVHGMALMAALCTSQVTADSWAMVLEYCRFHLVSGRSDKVRRHEEREWGRKSALLWVGWFLPQARWPMLGQCFLSAWLECKMEGQVMQEEEGGGKGAQTPPEVERMYMYRL